ncbi:hypothetical protein FF36_05468 [Frankia torreyi]|uniref:Uncharacterized protein n=1 Tax=Frankia torreyi TaxID=1856 RepID=A0A0D8B7V3_9ACTN|nr:MULTISPECIES: hypothetical protein [Frankia]KJE20246.1 hypothetical protein FF36_05468 [Frankia torreyi]KQM02540.1 hypothetical protein FF86_10638 [Frankia sp. CpI1-P]
MLARQAVHGAAVLAAVRIVPDDRVPDDRDADDRDGGHVAGQP